MEEDYITDIDLAELGSWVECNNAWIDSEIVYNGDMYTAGISTCHHGHIIQANGNTEELALRIITIVFEALSK